LHDLADGSPTGEQLVKSRGPTAEMAGIAMVIGQDRDRQPLRLGNAQQAEAELDDDVDLVSREAVNQLVGQSLPGAVDHALEIQVHGQRHAPCLLAA
jgi:hypothetical protein